MSDHDLFAVVGRQRACRAFSDAPVSDEDLTRLLDAAVHAPSAENHQPWEFVVVRDAATRAGIGELMRRAWEGGTRQWARTRLDDRIFADVDGGLGGGGVPAAPVLVVVGVDLNRCLDVSAAPSIFPAVQNLLLAATALGLGSALTTIATLFEEDLRDLVGLPDHVRPLAVVPIGHPARRLGPPRREPFASHTHRDRYGYSW